MKTEEPEMMEPAKNKLCVCACAYTHTVQYIWIIVSKFWPYIFPYSTNLDLARIL